MSELEFKIDGADLIDRELMKLGRKVKSRVMGKALRKGGKVIAKEAKQRAPEDSGDLKKAIGVVSYKSPEFEKQVLIMPRKGKRARYSAPYAHIVEFGSVFVKAQPFLGPAAHDKAGEAIKEVIKTLQEEIVKAYGD